MAAHETVTGLVSREVDTGDADRYLVLLTAEAGKVECFAKGIRNQKSKLASSAGILTFGEYKLFISKERRILVSAKAIERFPGLGLDIERYAYATHFLEIARDVIQEAQPFPEALQTLLNALFVLAYKETAPSFVARVFELRILALAGFAPVLDRCSVCGATSPRNFSFDTCGAGLVCESEGCRAPLGASMPSAPAPAPVSLGAVRAMRHVAACAANDIFNFAVSAAVEGELARIVPAYLRNQFGREYPRLAEAERYRAFEEEALYLAARANAANRTTLL
jgi:DNA repair protein RecO (recombination protein O)